MSQVNQLDSKRNADAFLLVGSKLLGIGSLAYIIAHLADLCAQGEALVGTGMLGSLGAVIAMWMVGTPLILIGGLTFLTGVAMKIGDWITRWMRRN